MLHIIPIRGYPYGYGYGYSTSTRTVQYIYTGPYVRRPKKISQGLAFPVQYSTRTCTRTHTRVCCCAVLTALIVTLGTRMYATWLSHCCRLVAFLSHKPRIILKNCTCVRARKTGDIACSHDRQSTGNKTFTIRNVQKRSGLRPPVNESTRTGRQLNGCLTSHTEAHLSCIAGKGKARDTVLVVASASWGCRAEVDGWLHGHLSWRAPAWGAPRLVCPIAPGYHLAHGASAAPERTAAAEENTPRGSGQSTSEL